MKSAGVLEPLVVNGGKKSAGFEGVKRRMGRLRH